MSDDDFLQVEAADCPMSSCAAPAGSPCRTGRGRVAAQYHTARFRIVPHLAKALSVPVPALRSGSGHSAPASPRAYATTAHPMSSAALSSARLAGRSAAAPMDGSHRPSLKSHKPIV